MPVLSTVEARLYLHKHNIAKEPEKHGNVKKLVANYETTMVRNCTGVTVQSTPCCINELHDPVDSQS